MEVKVVKAELEKFIYFLVKKGEEFLPDNQRNKYLIDVNTYEAIYEFTKISQLIKTFKMEYSKVDNTLVFNMSTLFVVDRELKMLISGFTFEFNKYNEKVYQEMCIGKYAATFLITMINRYKKQLKDQCLNSKVDYFHFFRTGEIVEEPVQEIKSPKTNKNIVASWKLKNYTFEFKNVQTMEFEVTIEEVTYNEKTFFEGLRVLLNASKNDFTRLEFNFKSFFNRVKNICKSITYNPLRETFHFELYDPMESGIPRTSIYSYTLYDIVVARVDLIQKYYKKNKKLFVDLFDLEDFIENGPTKCPSYQVFKKASCELSRKFISQFVHSYPSMRSILRSKAIYNEPSTTMLMQLNELLKSHNKFINHLTVITTNRKYDGTQLKISYALEILNISTLQIENREITRYFDIILPNKHVDWQLFINAIAEVVSDTRKKINFIAETFQLTDSQKQSLITKGFEDPNIKSIIKKEKEIINNNNVFLVNQEKQEQEFWKNLRFGELVACKNCCVSYDKENFYNGLKYVNECVKCRNKNKPKEKKVPTYSTKKPEKRYCGCGTLLTTVHSKRCPDCQKKRNKEKIQEGKGLGKLAKKQKTMTCEDKLKEEERMKKMYEDFMKNKTQQNS